MKNEQLCLSEYFSKNPKQSLDVDGYQGQT